MSLSPRLSTVEMSTCSESRSSSSGLCGEAATDTGEDNTERSVRIPTAVRNTSSLDHDSIEGFMVVHQKKKQRQRFLMSKSTHYVVANTTKHTLEIYNNESRSELIYLLSLADAVLSFESDNANIVMEKCFCVEVRTWKKKNTVRLQPQGFIFFEENQARMLLWVKCIHGAIKRATTLDSELFRSPSTASSSIEPVWSYSENDESRVKVDAIPSVTVSEEDSLCASNVASPVISPTTSSAFATAREKLTQRLAIGSSNRIASAGRTMMTPTRSSSSSAERQPNRWGSIFSSNDKQHQTRSPMSSTATDASASIETTASPRLSFKGKRSSKTATDVSSETAPSQNIETISSFLSRSSRAKTSTAVPSKNDIVPTGNLAEVVPVQPATTKRDISEALPTEANQWDTSAELVDDPGPVALRVLTIMLTMTTIAGVLGASVFLPIALAGSLAHFYNQHQCFSTWILSSVAVYLASRYHVLFGIGTASTLLYMWGYARFKTRRRYRLQRKVVMHFGGSETKEDIAHVEIPNWMRYPDVDRVEWLNKVFVTGWPYLKKAIEDFTPSSEEVRRSPLAKKLFQIEGVTRVFFGKDFISVTKTEDEDWDALNAEIFATIMDFFASDEQVMSDEPIITDTTILPDDDEVVAMIKELLEQRIRPSVQDDGGDIFYKGFDEKTGMVLVQLAGSCAGCPSSSVTLKHGVENMLKHYIPEVRGIEEWVDEELNAVNEKEFRTLEEKLRSVGIPSE
ncbi:Queuine tRNA-ribosyltransferase [Phytophthora nicotianae]|uniref:Queuine tRNA-ribosyltransferase n=1 Tax=Phytophthora nicotianae TaxID=4792 RepID=A0A0W8DFX1_PHYNI|nr:Queuine tRNA-ribosyltransferase [Phytophthora nicotianae]